MSQQSQQQHVNVAGGTPVVVMDNRPVVQGGHLKKPWVPELLMKAPDPEAGPLAQAEPLRIDGRCFFSLSSNDYGLGQFLFGKANCSRGRCLPRTQIVKHIWRARIAAQNAAMRELRNAQGSDAAGEEDLLDNVFGSSVADVAVDAQALPGERRKERRARAAQERALFERLPWVFQVSVPSSQPGVESVEFLVARGKETSLPAIACTKEVLQTLFRECAAEGSVAASSSSGPAPRTPTRRNVRRKNPLTRSPGASSPQEHSGSKRKLPFVCHERKARRVIARWRDGRGAVKSKSFALKDANRWGDGDSADLEVSKEEALARAQSHLDSSKEEALAYAKCRHCKPASWD